MNKMSEHTRIEALKILMGLAQRLRSLTADIIYEALHESGFSGEEKALLLGPIIRTASSRGWLTRTNFSVKSRRNHSNLQCVWVSELFGRDQYGVLPKEEIENTYEHWRGKQFVIPDALAETWKRIKEAAKLFPEIEDGRGTYRS